MPERSNGVDSRSTVLSAYLGSNPSPRIVNMKRKIAHPIAIDFDGVLAEYEGYKGEEILGKPIHGAKEFINKILDSGLSYVIFTTKPAEKVMAWINKNKFPKPESITNKKIPSPLYIDDRCIRFVGDFDKLLEDIKNFHPYWKEDKIFKEYFDS